MDLSFGLPEPEQANDPVTLDDVISETQNELEQVEKELREIGILIQQTGSEVEKLAQRNAQINNKVRSMEGQIDTQPREYIQETYKAAQDAQGRLFMMRGQVEQLQSRQQHLQRYADRLEHILHSIGNTEGGGSNGSFTRSQESVPGDNAIVEIIDAQESERQILAQQLHDGPAQSLTNLILQAEICERLFDKDPLRARDELSSLKESVNETFQKVRSYIFDLRPMMLDDLGLIPTLKQYTREFETKTNIDCEFEVMGDQDRLPSYIEVILFRVIQALLNNVEQHAEATRVVVTMDRQDDRVTVSVEDDGSGFEIDSLEESPKMGIRSVQKRISMLGGDISIDSNIGRGTTASIWLPLQD